ncbi:MAG: ABC transporter ATP-binding protein [Treponemataceae bacterium]|nr:ABC transporter ATP-binding protein [Treponemataceae bacterium]
MSQKKLLSVKELNVSYGKKEIIKNLSFDMQEGCLICLCGPNGSGKSTLLSVLAGIKHSGLTFSKNSIFFPCGDDNLAIEKLKRKQLSEKVSCMVQNETCVWDFSVEEFVMLGRYVHGDENSRYAHQLVDSCMEECGVKNLAGRSINSLSGGEVQKARIARSLVQQSQIMLLDEPCANLDFDAQFSMLKKIRELCHQKAISAIVSIHDLNLASLFADKILLLPAREAKNECQSFYFGSVEEIFKSQILSRAFDADFEIFTHPEYKLPQIYIKA